jgi:hypothetical protein
MAITTTTVTGIESFSAISGGTIPNDPKEFLPIVDRILKNKFQLYNRSRQKITSAVQSTTPLRPFQLFADSKQETSGVDKPFVMGGFRYNLCRDIFEVELFEYDNTTDINLV